MLQIGRPKRTTTTAVVKTAGQADIHGHLRPGWCHQILGLLDEPRSRQVTHVVGHRRCRRLWQIVGKHPYTLLAEKRPTLGSLQQGYPSHKGYWLWVVGIC